MAAPPLRLAVSVIAMRLGTNRPLLKQPEIDDFTPFSGCLISSNITILLKKDKSS